MYCKIRLNAKFIKFKINSKQTKKKKIIKILTENRYMGVARNFFVVQLPIKKNGKNDLVIY